MATALKHLVSKNSRRFNENGFDLDLTYIKPNIIAMGFPSERLEGIYRNHIDEVIRFLDDRHSDHYRVYNLCSEKSYDPGKFHQRVVTYPFGDDNAPPFELIKPFCEDVDDHLKADDRNVAVVHCSNGKSRTGTMICAYMLHDRLFDSTADALQFFGEARTQNARGVTLPSQRQYVQYYGHLLRFNLTYTPKTVLLKSIRFNGIPTMQGGTCVPYFTVKVQQAKIYTSKVYEHIKRTDSSAELLLPQELPLCGDVKIEFFHQARFGGKETMLTLWFNTFFIDMHLLQQRIYHIRSSSQETKGPKSQSKPGKMVYKNAKSSKKDLKKQIKKSSRTTGVDITTGCTRVVHRQNLRSDEEITQATINFTGRRSLLCMLFIGEIPLHS